MTEDEILPSADNLPMISIVYPSREFLAQNEEFESRYASMLGESKEHYELLVELQQCDAPFARLLNTNHKRKLYVE